MTKQLHESKTYTLYEILHTLIRLV